MKEVIDIADELANYLNKQEIIDQINELNQLGNSSKEIQDIFIDYCKKNLGFEYEREGLFKDYNFRIDYYKKLNTGGIILEVERGKTIANNMDLYDLWKCHICKEANHLFLIVPKSVSHTSGIYKSVFNRLYSFFEEENFINVDSIFLYGY